MLTRSQVAQRLGRSLATVRRLEGTVLHPQQDPQGVHRFDPDEVEAVASHLAETGSVWQSSNAVGTEHSHHYGTQKTVWPSSNRSASQEQLADAQHRAQRAERELRRYQERVARVFGRLGRELVEIDPDLGDLIVDAMSELE